MGKTAECTAEPMKGSLDSCALRVLLTANAMCVLHPILYSGFMRSEDAWWSCRVLHHELANSVIAHTRRWIILEVFDKIANFVKLAMSKVCV